MKICPDPPDYLVGIVDTQTKILAMRFNPSLRSSNNAQFGAYETLTKETLR